jgi:hypothetical protein
LENLRLFASKIVKQKKNAIYKCALDLIVCVPFFRGIVHFLKKKISTTAPYCMFILYHNVCGAERSLLLCVLFNIQGDIKGNIQENSWELKWAQTIPINYLFARKKEDFF